MTDKDKSLVAQNEQQQAQHPEEETFSQSLGGYQALVLLVITVLVIFVVFAFPTPKNPAADLPDAAPADIAAADSDTQDVEDTPIEEAAAATEEASAAGEEDAPTGGEVDTSPTEEAEAPAETDAAPAPAAEEGSVEGEAVATPEIANEGDTSGADEPAEDEADPAADAAAEEEPAVVGVTESVADVVTAGDPALGEQVFNTTYQTEVGTWMCASCHSVDESQVRLVGPGLWGVSERGGERIAETGGPDVPTYVYNSVVSPAAYIVPADESGPFPAALMPPNWGEVLTEEELNGVIAYVLSLGS